jgi:hypothetical protein
MLLSVVLKVVFLVYLVVAYHCSAFTFLLSELINKCGWTRAREGRIGRDFYESNCTSS